MLYVIHHDRVVSAALNFAPGNPQHWLRGQIIHFATLHGSLPATAEYVLVMGLSGEGWHLEVANVSFPLPSPGTPPGATVTARVLRRLKADDESLALVNAYANRVLLGREDAPAAVREVRRSDAA